MSTSSSSGNSSSTPSSTDASSFTFSSPYDDSSFSLSSSSIRQFSLEEINIATNNFDKERIIGEGGEAIVYKAELYLDTRKTWVAVKRLSKNSTEFVKEIQIVSKIQHQHVVALHGYCNDFGEKILIYEYMKNGSLSDYVKKNIKFCLTWEQRLNICLTAAYGLQHLHKESPEFSKGIIHRDVKPANILLNEDWVAKVSDFGMFKLSDSAQSHSTLETRFQKGTAGYFAPEYCMSYILTRKADVYAFGVVLFEVLCRKKPWDRGDLSYCHDKNEDLGVWARENVDIEIRKDISSGSLKAFTDAIGKCLQYNREKRPTMNGVVQSLEFAIKFQERQNEDLTTGLKLFRVEETPSQEAPEPAYERGTSTQPAITLTEVPCHVMLGISKHEEAPATPQRPFSPLGEACSRADLAAIHAILVMTHYRDDEGSNELSFQEWTHQAREMLKVRKRGDQVFRDKDFKPAIDCYSEFVDMDIMRSPTVYVRRSLCYLMCDQADAALRDAMHAQCGYPDWPTSVYMQSVALAKLDMHQDSLDMLNEAAELEEKRGKLNKKIIKHPNETLRPWHLVLRKLIGLA